MTLRRTDLTLAALAGAALAVCYLVFVIHPRGQVLDDQAMRSASALATQAWWADPLLSSISAASVLLATTTIAIGTSLAHPPIRVTQAVLTTVLTLVSSQVLQALLPRHDLRVESATNSFPSGHVAAIAGIAAGLLVALGKSRCSVAAAAAAGALTVATSAATVILQWHRPSDCIGAVLLAAVSACLARSLLPESPEPRPTRVPASPGPQARHPVRRRGARTSRRHRV